MGTILIIADDPPSHEHLIDELTQDGHIVLVAATADEVVACLHVIVVECIIAQHGGAPLRRDDVAAALRVNAPSGACWQSE